MSIGHFKYTCTFKTNPTKGLASPRQADSCLYRCFFSRAPLQKWSQLWLSLLMCAGGAADCSSRENYSLSRRLKVLLLIRRFLCVETIQ